MRKKPGTKPQEKPGGPSGISFPGLSSRNPGIVFFTPPRLIGEGEGSSPLQWKLRFPRIKYDFGIILDPPKGSEWAFLAAQW